MAKLKRIVYQAEHKGLIEVHYGTGLHTSLNALAYILVFKPTLLKVVRDCRLVYDQVRDQTNLKCLYNEVSKHAQRNGWLIIIKVKDITSNECSALITYLLLQG